MMKRIKWLLLALVLVVTLIAAHVYFDRQLPVGGHTIELTAYGFFPVEITIVKGDTVTFTTQRNEPFWPASDPHPIHIDLPPFDSQKALKPGERWSFTFNQSGTFTYHDHLGSYYSADSGVIRVLDSPQEKADESSAPLPPVSDTLADCSQASSSRKCWLDNLKSTMVHHGLPATFSLLKSLYETESGFAANCNDVTHYVGGFAYRVFEDKRTDVVIPESTYCAAGFYHGFLETWFHNNPELDEALAFCDYVTDALGETDPHVIHDCYHGIGHGAYHLYHVSDWSNFATVMKPIFAICEQTKDASSCINGVFNAANMDYHETRYKFLNPKENPFQYCDQLDQYQDICYRGFTGSLVWSGEGSLAGAVEMIKTIKNPELAQGALISAVQVTAFSNTGAVDKHQEVLSVCRDLYQNLKTTCLEAYVRGLMEQGSPGGEKQTGLDFCSQKLLTTAEKDTCLNYVREYSRVYYPEEENL